MTAMPPGLPTPGSPVWGAVRRIIREWRSAFRLRTRGSGSPLPEVLALVVGMGVGGCSASPPSDAPGGTGDAPAVGSGSAPAASREEGDAGTLRVVSYNIRHGRGTDDVLDLDRTAATLRALSPDIVGLQEVDRGVERSEGVDQAAELGRALELHSAFGAFMDYQGGEYGMAILSRHPMVRTWPVHLPPGNEPRMALAAAVALPGGDTVVVVNVHFDWVDDDAFRFLQATTLASVLDTLSHPYILLGDLNDEPGSRTLSLFQERALEAAKPAADAFTFSSDDPRKEIDFIFAAPRAGWGVRETRVIQEPLASDHRPVLAVLERPPGE